MITPKLKIRELRKTYGPVVALAGANLEMPEGEFLTLLGPSGSGKTTLLMMIAGLVQPDSGEVWVDGKLATYAPPHDERAIACAPSVGGRRVTLEVRRADVTRHLLQTPRGHAIVRTIWMEREIHSARPQGDIRVVAGLQRIAGP